MERKQIVDIGALLALNPDLEDALYKREAWAWRHMKHCESLNAGEPEGFRRPFDGKPRKWCGEACSSPEGCIVCTLPEDYVFAKFQREFRDPLALARSGVIQLRGEVDNAMVTHVRDMLAEVTAHAVDELEIQIESDGGDGRSGFAIYQKIREAQVKKRRGVVRHYARSAAAVILQACDIREAGRGARILIHYLRYKETVFTLPELQKGERVKSMLETGEAHHERILSIFMERTGRTREEIEKEYQKEADMTSAEALTFGLIDTICL